VRWRLKDVREHTELAYRWCILSWGYLSEPLLPHVVFTSARKAAGYGCWPPEFISPCTDFLFVLSWTVGSECLDHLSAIQSCRICLRLYDDQVSRCTKQYVVETSFRGKREIFLSYYTSLFSFECLLLVIKAKLYGNQCELLWPRHYASDIIFFNYALQP
jgi:hypothetical protein